MIFNRKIAVTKTRQTNGVLKKFINVNVCMYRMVECAVAFGGDTLQYLQNCSL